MFLVAAFDQASAQLFLILAVNVLLIIYFIAIKPYIHSSHLRHYNNNVTIHNLFCFSILIIIIIAYNMNYNSISYASRLLIGDIICYFIIYSATANFIYMGVRSYLWYYRKVWKPFSQT